MRYRIYWKLLNWQWLIGKALGRECLFLGLTLSLILFIERRLEGEMKKGGKEE